MHIYGTHEFQPIAGVLPTPLLSAKVKDKSIDAVRNHCRTILHKIDPEYYAVLSTIQVDVQVLFDPRSVKPRSEYRILRPTEIHRNTIFTIS